MARVHGLGFDDASIPPPRPRGRRSPRVGRKPPGKITLVLAAAGILCTLGGGIAGFATSVTSLPYRAGWAGTAGTASLIVCEEVPSARSSEIDCWATFTADDGPVTAPDAVIEGHTELGDHDYPARLHPGAISTVPGSATISIVSTATVLFALSGVFGSLILIFLIGGCGSLLAVATVRRRLGRPVIRSKWPLLAVLIATGVAAVTAVVLAIVGSAIGG